MFGIISSFLFGTQCSSTVLNTFPEDWQPYTSADGLKQLLEKKSKDFLLIDVRTKEEYLNGHIPSAINVPNGDLSILKRTVSKDMKLMVYCRSGHRSKRAGEILSSQGYQFLYDFGGIKNWHYAIETKPSVWNP